jgi:hypothetical protein
MRIDDPALRRRLVKACRRTGLVRRRRWWRRRSGRSTLPLGAIGKRLILVAVIALTGHVVGDVASASQLLSLAGLIAVQVRIFQLHTRLHQDPALAVLAQFPLTTDAIFAHQMRGYGRNIVWLALDAAGFWSVAWIAMGQPIPWWWLPFVAIAHVAVTEWVAVIAMRHWPSFGCFGILPLGLVVLGTVRHESLPILWVCAEPILTTVAWITPWGWVNQLALHAPRGGWLPGAGLIVIAAAATILAELAHARLRREWRLDPGWRECAGRPDQTWHDEWPDEEEPTADVPAGAGSVPVIATVLTEASPVGSGSDVTCAAAFSHARAAAPGRQLRDQGWAGARTARHCDHVDVQLADLLGPRGGSPAARRWAMLLVGLPAICCATGISTAWGMGFVLMILLVRRRWFVGAVVATFVAALIHWPEYAPSLGSTIPCGLALLMTVPLAGGGWNGLPMSGTPLGSSPRNWRRLMMIMATFTGYRFLANAPILALACVALGFGVDPMLSFATGAAWIAMMLGTPSFSAMLLVKRDWAGVELSLGRRWLTSLNVFCVLMHLLAALSTVSGACLVLVNGVIQGVFLALMSGGMALSLVVSGLHLAVLRHAYRRTVDFVLSEQNQWAE